MSRPVTSGRRYALFAALVAALLAGCASVQVQRAKDVSAAGLAYTQAVVAIIDVAVDASIDYSSGNLVRVAAAAPLPAASQAAREAELRSADALLIRSTLAHARLKRSVLATQAYFTALQQLADGSTAEATETAVKNLADRLNAVDTALDKSADGKPLLADAQRDAIGGLAKLVTSQVHGTKLAAALQRDAAVVGTALALQEKVLQAASDDIGSKLANEAARFYVDNVLRPYKSGELGAMWSEDRKTYVKVAAVGQSQAAVDTARAAASQMQTVWARVLSGEYSAKELTAMLKDTEDLLAAANALKDAKAK